MIVHPSSSNSLEPSLWIRAVPRCVRRGTVFSWHLQCSLFVRLWGEHLWGSSVGTGQYRIEVVPVDMLLLKMCRASSKSIWHLDIILPHWMGHILSPELLSPLEVQGLPGQGQFPQAGREAALSPSVIPRGGQSSSGVTFGLCPVACSPLGTRAQALLQEELNRVSGHPKSQQT